MTTNTAAPHTWSNITIRPRKMDFPFDDQAIPRYWIAGSPVLTHLANGLNLLFPAGERFFIRSCRPWLEDVRDAPHLYEQLRGFMAQEVRHGLEHERFFQTLRDQGYDIDTFLARYEHLAYNILENLFPPEARLSTTAALEHFTAIFGDVVLTHGLDHAHPALRELLMWHAAEEIEHKCVTFDLLQRVDPSYALRMLGLTLATLSLIGFWAAATADLLRQDRALHDARTASPPPMRAAAALRFAFFERGLAPRLARGFLDYMRPDFHPAQHDNFHLATAYLRSIGRG